MRGKKILSAAGILLASTGLAAASTLVVDRGLPTDNLNFQAGNDRSNIAWAGGTNPEGLQRQTGDTFTLGPSGGAEDGWQIDQLRTWFWAVNADDRPDKTISDLYNGISLFLGPSSEVDPIPLIAQTGITGDSADAPNVTITEVTYAGSEPFERRSNVFKTLWQIDFFDLGTLAPGDYMFGLAGDPAEPGELLSDNFFIHASNADLGGVPADGADGLHINFTGLAGDPFLTFERWVDSGPVSEGGLGLFNASTDLNIQVYASPIPLPGALPLMAGGLGLLGVMGWRRRRASA